MRSVEGDIPSRFDGSVEPDYEMIADGTETARTVPAVDVGGCEILSRTGGGTVNDNSVFDLENLLSFVYFKLLIIK